MRILDRVKKGEILQDIEIYDAHTHLGKWYSVTIRENNARDLVAMMDYMKFRRMCLSSSLSICSDFKRGNDEVMDAIALYPDKFFGYITINPNYPDGMMQEIHRLEDHKNLIGLKIHPHYTGVPVNDKRYEEVFSYAEKKHWIVLVHTFSYGDVILMQKVIEAHPDAKFILAHCGAHTGMELTAKIIREYPNAYCDLPIGSAPFKTVEYLVENGDENKILFGTDSPLADYRITYGRVLFSDISDEAKKKIMGLNFKACLGIK